MNTPQKFFNQETTTQWQKQFLIEWAHKASLTPTQQMVFLYRFHKPHQAKSIPELCNIVDMPQDSFKKHLTVIYTKFSSHWMKTDKMDFSKIYHQLWEKEFQTWLEAKGISNMKLDRRRSTVEDHRKPENLPQRIWTEIQLYLTRKGDNYLEEMISPHRQFKLNDLKEKCEAALNKFLFKDSYGYQVLPAEALSNIFDDIPTYIRQDISVRHLIEFVAQQLPKRFSVITDRRLISEFQDHQQGLSLNSPFPLHNINVDQEPPLAA
jgi:hypothetical protein